MRPSLRVGLVAALIIFALVLINRQLHNVSNTQDPQSFWHFDTTSFRAALRPQQPVSQEGIRRKWGSGTNHKIGLSYQTTPIEVPNEGVIVMGKLSHEDTAWVSAELAEWRNYIYTVDNTNTPTHTPKNKGRESLPYLQYIVDHYDDLPAVIVFLHSHRDGFPAGWHTDSIDYSNVESVRALQRDFVQQQGFVNLRCQTSPGCPDEIKPFRSPPNTANNAEKHYATAWKQLFGNSNVPDTVAAPCCSQFAVSRDQVLARPLKDYKRMYDWVLNNELPDEVTAGIMEYSWHIIFGQAAVFCPDVFQCYADVYGEIYDF